MEEQINLILGILNPFLVRKAPSLTCQSISLKICLPSNDMVDILLVLFMNNYWCFLLRLLIGEPQSLAIEITVLWCCLTITASFINWLCLTIPSCLDLELGLNLLISFLLSVPSYIGSVESSIGNTLFQVLFLVMVRNVLGNYSILLLFLP